MSIIDTIENGKIKLRENNIEPRWIKLSPAAHDALVKELNLSSGKKRYCRVFEILGLKVEIEEECPDGGAYLLGFDRELWKGGGNEMPR